MSAAPSLALAGVTFRYPAQAAPALGGVSLAVTAGEVVRLRGPLGAGCSTLLLVAAGLAPRHTGGDLSGTVRLLGLDPHGGRLLAALVGQVAWVGADVRTQLSGVATTVRDEVAFAPANLGWPVSRIVAATDAALAALGLAAFADRDPARLSGGEQQRVVLAAMLALAPAVWLLDDPTAALDADGVSVVRAVLTAEATRGAAIVVASEDDRLFPGLAHRTVELEAGCIVGDRPGGLAEPTRGVLALSGGTGGTVEARVQARRAGGAPGPAALAFEGVSFGHGGRAPGALREVSLRVSRGEGVALLGHNGAGKSTLLRLAVALAHPDRGAVVVTGRATQGLVPEDLAPVVGFGFQDPGVQLFAGSVRAELAFGPRALGWPPDRIAARVAQVLARLDLAAHADAHPYDLPLPLRRLVTLGVALMAEPALLLLDEPTAGLDAPRRALVADLVRAVCAAGTAVVAVTHDLPFAHAALPRTIRLERGAVVADGPTAVAAPA